MRICLWSGLVACALAGACGSSESVGAGGAGPLGDAGPDTSPPAVDAGEASTPDGSTCAWPSYDDGLSGAAIVDVLFDTRTTPGLDTRSTPDVVYATGGDAIYQSQDGGQTWHQQGTFAGGSIEYLAAPGSDPSTLLATSSAGVLKSTDEGQTWSVISLEGVAVRSIAVASGQPLRVYVGIDSLGLLRSDDGGGTWSPVVYGYPSMATLAIDVAPDDPDDVIAVGPTLNPLQGGWSTAGAIMHTTDGGQSWQTVVAGDGNIINVRRCGVDPTILYAATHVGVARSSDRGLTWSTLLPGSEVEDVAISPTDCDDIYAMVELDGPHHSTDGGQTFGPTLTQGLDFDTMGLWPGRMAVDPVRAGGVVLGGHAGVWYTANRGTQWNVATGILGLSVLSLSASPLDPGRLWLASWGSGVWQRASASQSWQHVPAATLPVDYAFAVATDPAVANRVFVGGWGTLYGSSNGGTSFAASAVDENEEAFAFDPTNPGVVYVATQVSGLYKSIDSGVTWTLSNGALQPWVTYAGTFIDTRSVAVDPANSQTVYIGTNGRGLYQSSDGGGSWSSVLSPTDAIPCLLFAAGTPATLYVCDTGNGVQSSTDGGAHFAPVNDGLGTLDVTTLVQDTSTGDLYAASSLGVYVKHGTQSWTALDAPCWPGGAAGPAVILQNGSQSSLVVAAGGGVYVHAL
jgi:photosystem II stability/assembly factor-like uncharacterized protein